MAYTPELSYRGSATLRRLAWFGGVGGVFAGDIVLGRMNEKEFMGGLGLAHLGIEPA
jgi:hypothetical protein